MHLQACHPPGMHLLGFHDPQPPVGTAGRQIRSTGLAQVDPPGGQPRQCVEAAFEIRLRAAEAATRVGRQRAGIERHDEDRRGPVARRRDRAEGARAEKAPQPRRHQQRPQRGVVLPGGADRVLMTAARRLAEQADLGQPPPRPQRDRGDPAGHRRDLLYFRVAAVTQQRRALGHHLALRDQHLDAEILFRRAGDRGLFRYLGHRPILGRRVRRQLHGQSFGQAPGQVLQSPRVSKFPCDGSM